MSEGQRTVQPVAPDLQLNEYDRATGWQAPPKEEKAAAG